MLSERVASSSRPAQLQHLITPYEDMEITLTGRPASQYDSKWAVHKEYRHFDYATGVGEVQGFADVLGKCALCVIDPPYIDKAVWHKYLEAADALLVRGGQVLLTTIPENESMLQSLWARLGRESRLLSHPFVPVNTECLHKFAVFTTFPAAALSVENTEEVMAGQGLGQQMLMAGAHADDGDDEIDGMFGGLQAAVISSVLDTHDSDHETESDDEVEASYAFDPISKRIVPKSKSQHKLVSEDRN